MVKETEKGKAYMEGWELPKYVGKGSADGGGLRRWRRQG